MLEGRASRTAELVCMGRAVANGKVETARFSDPTATLLLPEESRDKVARLQSGKVPRGLRSRLRRAYVLRQSKVMVARTVAIDDVVRAARSPQLVILGAGLDGRAFRMPELRDVVVFEVDHPDSQRDKRARAAALTPTAKDVRFVPVNFERGELARALEAAGHDAATPTTWIWEGVVMYLALPDIEATLRVIQQRSAAGSVLTVIYHQPATLTTMVGFILRFIGEPLRSAFEPAQMRALLARHDFAVSRDESIAEIGRTMSSEVADGTKPIHHLRLVTATRE